MECRQEARQSFLIRSFKGSNPFTPSYCARALEPRYSAEKQKELNSLKDKIIL